MTIRHKDKYISKNPVTNTVKDGKKRHSFIIPLCYWFWIWREMVIEGRVMGANGRGKLGQPSPAVTLMASKRLCKRDIRHAVSIGVADAVISWWKLSYASSFFSSSLAWLSMAFIFSRTNSTSSLSFCTFRFISSTRLLPFLLEIFKKPRLFS